MEREYTAVIQKRGKWYVAWVEEVPGVPSMARQYAIASFWKSAVPYFVTFDDALLIRRDMLEDRYGLKILSIQEAIMLLRDTHGPVD